MLILTRKVGQSILVGDDIEIILTDIKKGSVRIGIVAPNGLQIYRKEVFERIKEENLEAAKNAVMSKDWDKIFNILKTHLGGEDESNN